MELLAPPPAVSIVTVVSLLVCILQASAAVLLTGWFGGRSSREDRWTLLWLFYDVIVHVTLWGQSNHRQVLWLNSEYGKADYRWLVSDPTIVSLEILTFSLDSLLGLLLIHAVLHKKYYRHFLQISLSMCELYGGWMTFCPEWLVGSPNLHTSHWLHLWVYLLFFNLIWVLVPAMLLLQSWVSLKQLSMLQVGGDQVGEDQVGGAQGNKKKL